MAQQEARRAVHIHVRDLHFPPDGQTQGVRGHNGGRVGCAATDLARETRNGTSGKAAYRGGYEVGNRKWLAAR